MKNILLTFAMMSMLAATVAAQDKHTGKEHHHDHAANVEIGKFLGKGDGVETCPVTGEELVNKDTKATFYGRTVYFCCAGCMAQAQKNPVAYIKKTHKEQLAAVKDLPKPDGHHDHAAKAGDEKGEQKFLGKGDGIETCPVTGEPVNKDLKGEVDGQEFYVCCAGCLETVKKNPELYLKKPAKK